MSGKQISSLSIILGATVAPFANAFSSASGTVSGFATNIESVGSTLLKFTGIVGLVDAATHALEAAFAAPGEALAAAKRQIDAETKLGAVLNATGDAAGFTVEQLKAHAAALQQTTTFGDEAIIGFQATLATFRNVSGDAFNRATSAALDMSTVLGTDLQGTAIQLGKALNDPVQGLTALRRVGVSFTAQQRDQIKAMQQSGNLMGAQSVILDELANEFGGAAEAMAKTPFGQLKQLGNAFGDLQEQVGIALANVLTSFSSAFDVKGVIERTGAAVGQAGAWIGEQLATWVPYIVGVFESVGSAIIPVVETVGGMVWSAVSAAWTAVYDFVAPIVTSIYDYVAANWQSILTTVVSVSVSMWEMVSGIFEGIWSVITSVADAVSSAWTGAMNLLGFSSDDAANQSGGAVGQIVSGWQWVENIIATVTTAAAYFIAHWKDVLILAATDAELAIVTFGNQVAYIFSDVIPPLLEWFGQNWFNILHDAATLAGTIFSNISSNIVNILKNLPGLISGSVSFADLWTPVTDGFHATMSALPAIADRQAGPLEQALQDQATDMQNTLGDGLANAFAQHDADTSKITNSITKAVADAGAHMPTLQAPTIKPPAPVPVKAKADTTQASNAIDALKGKLDDFGNIQFGSAEQMQRLAQASLPQLAPLSASATTNMQVDQPEPNDQPSSTDSQQLLALRQIAKNTQDSGVDVEEVDAGGL